MYKKNHKPKYGQWIPQKQIWGRTFLAVSEKDQRKAILKTSRKGAQRIKQEIDTLSKLNHPNVVSLIESGTQDGEPYLVTEYHKNGCLTSNMLNGISLADKLQMCKTIIDAREYCMSMGVCPSDNLSDIVLSDDGVTPILIDLEADGFDPEKWRSDESVKEAALIWEIVGPQYVMEKIKEDLKEQAV